MPPRYDRLRSIASNLITFVIWYVVFLVVCAMPGILLSTVMRRLGENAWAAFIAQMALIYVLQEKLLYKVIGGIRSVLEKIEDKKNKKNKKDAQK